MWLIYADEDLAACEELERHLSPWVRAGRIKVDYRARHPGLDPAEIVRALPASDSDVIWLVTVDSLADGHHEQEIDAASGHAIVPVILETTLWEHDPRLQPRRPDAICPAVKYTPGTSSDFWQEVAVQCWGPTPRAAWKRGVAVAAVTVLALVTLALAVSHLRTVVPAGSSDIVVAMPLGAPEHVASAHARLCEALATDTALQRRPPRCLTLTPSWATPVIGGISRIDLDAAPERPRLLILVSEAADNPRLASLELALGQDIPLGTLVAGIRPSVPLGADRVSRLARILVELPALVTPDTRTVRESVPVPSPEESGVAVTVLAALVRDMRAQPPDQEERRGLQAAGEQCASMLDKGGCGHDAATAVCCAGDALRTARDPFEPVGSMSECCLELSPILRPLILAGLGTWCSQMLDDGRSGHHGSGDAAVVYRNLAILREKMDLDIAFVGPAACAETLRERLLPKEPPNPALVVLASTSAEDVATMAIEPASPPRARDMFSAIAAGSLAQRGLLAAARGDWSSARRDYEVAAALVPAQPRYLIDWAEAALWQGDDDEVLRRLPTRLLHEELLPVTYRTHAAYLRWIAACLAGREVEDSWGVLDQCHAALQREPDVVRGVDDASGTLGALVCRQRALPERACALYRELTTSKAGPQRPALGGSPACAAR